MPSKKPSLAEVNPKLAREWHPTKNSGIKATDVSPGSGLKAWWKCPRGEDHEWQAAVYSRVSGTGCPCCSGRLAVPSNCLATVNPALASEWHPSKNGTLNPTNVTTGYSKKVWWKCPLGKDHEWKQSVSRRDSGLGCAVCEGKVVVPSTSLLLNNPEVADQWHPELNGSLSPAHVTPSSGKKVWWRCAKGPDHIWKTSVYNRAKGSGCPACEGSLAVRSNCLAKTHPNLASEWHPTMNNGLSAEDVVAGSHKKIWWKCPKGDDHVWKAQIKSRSNGKGCPACSGQLAVPSNCLATTHPELEAEWHPTRNENLTPKNVVAGSGKKVWWKCSVGDDHEWQQTIVNRRNGSGCPCCSGHKVVPSTSLAMTHPQLATEWHPTKNRSLTPHDVHDGSKLKAWWKCPKGDDHVWEARIYSRAAGNGCPVCSNRKVVPSNSLQTVNPQLASQWHPTLNKKLTPSTVTAQSQKHVWWKCPVAHDHIWKAPIHRRNGGVGCPMCAGHITVKSNCLSTTHPEVAAQWHPNKNAPIKPSDVTFGSQKNIWWQCDKGDDHIWRTTVGSRTSGMGCPACSGQMAVRDNCLAVLNPKLATEWHPTLNSGITPYDVTTKSGIDVWWQCLVAEDHIWRTNIAARSNGTGCPYCTLTPQSRQELTITFELLKFFKDINPRGFKTRVKGKLKSIDIFIPELNLGIEFDGSYWHKDKRALDKLKTERLKEDGFEIIRVREEPLRKITDADIVSSKPFNGKQVTDSVLLQIMRMFPIKGRLEARIKKYIAQDSLQNEKALDAYIEKVLEEKAAKEDSKSN